MRRLDHRYCRLCLVAAFLAAITVLGAVGTTPAFAYDDRPPLIASDRAAQGESPASKLVGLEVRQDGQGRVDVRLQADGTLGYDIFALEGPDRLVVDLPGVTVATLRERWEVDDSALVRIRVGQWQDYPTPVARVVLDFEHKDTWQVVRGGDGLALAIGTPAPAAAVTESAVPEPVTAAIETPAEPAPVDVLAEATPAPEPAPEAARPEPEPASLRAEPASEAQAVVEPAPAAPLASEPEPVVAETPAAAVAAEPVVAAPASVDQPAPYVATTASEEITPDAAGDATASGWTESEIDAVIEGASRLASAPVAAIAPAQQMAAEEKSKITYLPDFETKTIQDEKRVYNGTPISLQLVDADIKQVFGYFHDISGLNFVLDPAVSGQVTIIVDNVPWDQALDLILQNNSLDMVLDGNVVRIAPVTKLAQEAAARKALRDAKELEGAPVTITRTLSYAKARDVERIVREAILTPKGRVMIDERTNSVIIRDITSRIEATDALLSTLDAETPQVMIEARIVEVSRDFIKDLGVQWGFNADADPALGTETSLDFPHRANVGYDLNLPRRATASALGLSFGNVLDSFTLDITLDALEEEGYARRLSAPKIATQNNEKAEIEQGVRFPIVSTTATEIDVRFVAAALRLECLPQITAEGTVVLELTVENNQPDFVNTVGEVPSINTQRAETTVMIPDGGTTVIGGIFTVNEGKSELGVPWFRDIPGLGWLFRSRNHQTRNRELLIFVTPRIIKAS